MQLSAFIRGLDQLSSGVQFAEFKQRVADSGLKLIQRCFETESDPYGKRWKYVRYHEGHGSILDDSGTLKRGWRAMTIANGVRFYNDVPYARKQNYTRAMVPDAARGLPSDWKAAISRAFSKTVRDALKESL